MESEDRPAVEPAPEVAGPPTDGARLDPVKRLLYAFTSPMEVFEDIRRKPSWLVVMLLLMATTTAIVLIATPHVDMGETFRLRAAERGQDLNDEQIEQIVSQTSKFFPVQVAITPVFVAGGFALIAVVFFLMLKLSGSEVDYKRTLSATLYSYWPPTLAGSALFAILVQRLDTIPQQEMQGVVKSNLAAFMSPDAPAWQTAVASSLDVFNVWTVALLIIGLSAVGKVSRQKSAVAVLVPWAIYLVLKAGWAAIFG